MTQTLRIMPNGPLLFRDPRPFAAGAGGARTLPFPLPSVVAGTVRTMLARTARGGAFHPNDASAVKSWAVAGPLLTLGEHIFYPAPADAHLTGGSLFRKRPLPAGQICDGGTDLPLGLKRPVGIVGTERIEVGKPGDLPPFWSAALMERWLADPGEAPVEFDNGEVFKPEIDRRTHVAVRTDTSTADDGMLFTTEGSVYLRHEYITDDTDKIIGVEFIEGGLLVRVSDASLNGREVRHVADLMHRMGGEGRFALFESPTRDPWPVHPAPVRDALEPGVNLRMQLATPALFRDGWKPGWLNIVDGNLMGQPPGSGITLQLVGACIPRWQPFSGYDLTVKGNAGHKALKRLAPAGSVYFFQVLDGNPKALVENLWLHPISDDEQDRRDGFGLALWGVWNDSDNRRN